MSRLISIVIIVSVAACSGTETEDSIEGTVETSAGGIVVTLESSDPPQLFRGDHTWTFTISDEAGPMTGLDVDLVPFMPQHGHGTPVVAEASEITPGTYSIAPVNLWMGGTWESTLTFGDQHPDESVVFVFEVD